MGKTLWVSHISFYLENAERWRANDLLTLVRTECLGVLCMRSNSIYRQVNGIDTCLMGSNSCSGTIKGIVLRSICRRTTQFPHENQGVSTCILLSICRRTV